MQMHTIMIPLPIYMVVLPIITKTRSCLPYVLLTDTQSQQLESNLYNKHIYARMWEDIQNKHCTFKNSKKNIALITSVQNPLPVIQSHNPN